MNNSSIYKQTIQTLGDTKTEPRWSSIWKKSPEMWEQKNLFFYGGALKTNEL